MFFDNLLDDGETQAGAFGPRRHIGFKDAIPLGRQANAIVPHRDNDILTIPSERHANMAARAACIRFSLRLNGFDSVFDDIRQCLPELAPVTYQLQVAFVRDIFELNVRMGDFVQEQGVASDVANRLAAENAGHRLGVRWSRSIG